MDNLKKIGIILPEADLVLSSIVGTYKLLLHAIEESHAETEVLILGSSKTQRFFGDVFQLKSMGHFTEFSDLDLIIIPAIKSNISDALEDNKQLAAWIRDVYHRGAHVASLCSGVFLLGASGILDNKDCTCHWTQTEEFQRLFPKTNFKKNEIITECENVFTSGGAFSFLNLIIYLIERFYGREAAIKLYSIYQVDYSRKSQDPFVIFESSKDHLDKAIIDAQTFIEEHYAQPLTIAAISKKVNLTERTLSRRFKHKTSYTVNQFLQRVRIEVAKSLIAETDKTISEIQFEVGYNDPKTFRSIFKRQTRLAPLEYRRKYQIV